MIFFMNIRHPNYIMGLAVSELNFQENHLHIGVDSFVKEHDEIVDLSKEKLFFITKTVLDLDPMLKNYPMPLMISPLACTRALLTDC